MRLSWSFAIVLAALSVAPCGASWAFTPNRVPPPDVCRDRQDGTRVTLDAGNAPAAVYDGIETILVTCQRGGITGPATYKLGAEHTVLYERFRRHTIPSNARRIEVELITPHFSGNFDWHGSTFAFDEHSNKVFEGFFAYGAPKGRVRGWASTGQLTLDANYIETGGWVRGGPHGLQQRWHPTGQVSAREYFCNGYPVGRHTYFSPDGTIAKIEDYSESDYRHPNSGGSVRQIIRTDGSIDTSDNAGPGLPNPSYLNIVLGRIFRKTMPGGRDDMNATLYVSASSFAWTEIPRTQTVSDWVTPGKEIVIPPIDSLHTGRVMVTPTYHHRPLRDLTTSIVQSELWSTEAAMLSNCPWLKESFTN